MTTQAALGESERATVLAILNQHLPAGAKAHLFGSRATGQCKAWSDLDLVIEAPHVIPLSQMARLAEAFEESDLAWKVDLVDRRTVSEAFGKVIDATKVPLE